MVSLSNINQLDFLAEARVIHRMLILVTPINQKNCFYSTPKVVKLKLDNCNFIASVVIIIISTIYYNMLVRWGKKGWANCRQGGVELPYWRYLEREFAVSKRWNFNKYSKNSFVRCYIKKWKYQGNKPTIINSHWICLRRYHACFRRPRMQSKQKVQFSTWYNNRGANQQKGPDLSGPFVKRTGLYQ